MFYSSSQFVCHLSFLLHYIVRISRVFKKFIENSSLNDCQLAHLWDATKTSSLNSLDF